MKIAVCLCGEPRSIKNSSISIKYFFKELNVDYYCHAWKQNTVNNIEKISYKTKAPILLTLTEIEESNYYKDSYILKKYIQDIYKPIKIQVEECNIEGKYGQFISAERAINLVKSTNIKYDLLIKIRYDNIIYQPENELLNWLHSDFNQTILYTRHIRTEINEMCDNGLFIASFETMLNYLSNFENHLLNYKDKVAESIWFYKAKNLNIPLNIYSSNIHHSLCRPGFICENQIENPNQAKQVFMESISYNCWLDIFNKKELINENIKKINPKNIRINYLLQETEKINTKINQIKIFNKSMDYKFLGNDTEILKNEILEIVKNENMSNNKR